MFHILVVDDDKNTRRLMRAVLEGAGYTVTTAEDGEEALEALDRVHIDLVVLDIMMPKMDGYAFTQTLREGNNDMPILMVCDISRIFALWVYAYVLIFAIMPVVSLPTTVITVLFILLYTYISIFYIPSTTTPVSTYHNAVETFACPIRRNMSA